MRVRERRSELERALEVSLRGFDVALDLQREPQVVERFRVIWLPLERSAIALGRLALAPKAGQHEPAIEQRCRPIGLELECLIVGGYGFGVFAQSAVRVAEVVV